MKFCPFCGAENALDAHTCYSCGAGLTVDTTPAKKKRSKGSGGGALKGVLIGLGAVLAAGAVALGIAGSTKILTPKNQLKRAFDNTNKSFVQLVEKQDNLKGLIALMEHVSKQKEYSLGVTADLGDGTAEFSLDYSHPKKRLQGDISYNNAKMQFSGNKETLQMRFPNISQDVYGFSLKTLRKTKVATTLLNLLGNNFLDKVPNSLFSSSSAVDAGGTWKQLWKSADVESRDKQDGYKVYVVTWSRSNLEKLNSISSNNWMLKTLITGLEKTGASLTCYVKNGSVHRVEAVVAGDMYTLKFRDPDNNPWESFTIKSATRPDWSGEGGVVADGAKLRIFINANGEEVFSATYDEATGQLRIARVDAVEGYIKATPQYANISLRLAGGENVNIALSHLNGMPDKLAKKHIDLLHLRVADVAKIAVLTATNGEMIQNTVDTILQLIQR